MKILKDMVNVGKIIGYEEKHVLAMSIVTLKILNDFCLDYTKKN